MHLDLGDVFHEFLPEPVPKFGIFEVGWAPWREGKEFTFIVGKPTTLKGWEVFLGQYGPLIVSGKLGEVSSKLDLYVGHFILIIGVDIPGKKLVCKDPLKGDKTISYDFDWILDRIEWVSAVDPAKVQARWVAREKAETQRSIDAVLKLSPNDFQKLDDSWNDIL